MGLAGEFGRVLVYWGLDKSEDGHLSTQGLC